MVGGGWVGKTEGWAREGKGCTASAWAPASSRSLFSRSRTRVCSVRMERNVLRVCGSRNGAGTNCAATSLALGPGAEATRAVGAACLPPAAYGLQVHHRRDPLPPWTQGYGGSRRRAIAAAVVGGCMASGWWSSARAGTVGSGVWEWAPPALGGRQRVYHTPRPLPGQWTQQAGSPMRDRRPGVPPWSRDRSPAGPGGAKRPRQGLRLGQGKYGDRYRANTE